MNRNRRLVAVCGKGGAGKTAFIALAARVLLEDQQTKALLIDADPTMGLPTALGIKINRSVADIREEIINTARRGDREEKSQLANMIDYMLLEALAEGRGFGLLSMGRQESTGCFCPVNELLREAIEPLSQSFDITLIDGEAGIEQLNRRVMKSVDTLVIVTDPTNRGLAAAGFIKDMVQNKKVIKCQRMGLVINRIRGQADSFIDATNRLNIEVLGTVPDDQNITAYDSANRPLTDLPPAAPSVMAVKSILKTLELIS